MNHGQPKNENSIPKSNWLRWTWRMIAQAIWMMWLGGLTFYIAFVVPIGGEVIGAAQQGEITGRVTVYINVLGILASLVIACEGWQRKDRFLKVLACTMLLPQAILLVLHADLLQMQQDKPSFLLTSWSFYAIHRIYLWTTTLQWFLGLSIVGRMAMYREVLVLPSRVNARPE